VVLSAQIRPLSSGQTEPIFTGQTKPVWGGQTETEKGGQTERNFQNINGSFDNFIFHFIKVVIFKFGCIRIVCIKVIYL